MAFQHLLSLYSKKAKQSLKNLLSYKRLYLKHHSSRTLEKDDVKLANKWLKEKQVWFEPGLVREYEDYFAKWNGSKNALAYMSGREALSAAIFGLNLGQGDEVIIPAYTCVVVPNAFKYEGIKIVYVDIELDTYGIDITDLREKVNSQTKAILVHHLYGLVSRDFEEILDLTKEFNISIIEDCAHATGATFKGKKVGNFGDVAIYSTEQSKILNTIQGGIVSTNNQKIYDRLLDHYKKANYPDQELIERQLQTLRLYFYKFKSPYRCLVEPIYQYLLGNYRLVSTTKSELEQKKPMYYGRKMPAPIAAIGINQLKKNEKFVRLRKEKANEWESWCKRNGYETPLVVDNSNPVWLRYPVLMEANKKSNTEWAKKALGVKLGMWFKSHLHPSEVKIEGHFPNAEKAVKQCVNFPTL